MRTAVVASGFKHIGKETGRRWEQRDDISMIESEITVYTPEETDELVTDPVVAEGVDKNPSGLWRKRRALVKTR